MADTITKRLRMRQGDSATAKANNEVLRQGEPFWETDTGEIKIGDGETHYNNLLGLVSEAKIAQQIAQGIYEGNDLTVKFALEIGLYSSVADWLHARCAAGNFTGIYPGDYFWDNMAAGTIAGTSVPATRKKIYIAGIDLYYGTGDTEINTHHITCFTLSDQNMTWNDVNNNNGSGYSEHPWVASKLYAVLNGVNNASTNKVGACGYNASGAGYYQLFSSGLRARMIEQRAFMGKRYSTTAALNDNNGQAWVGRGLVFAPSEIEVYGCPIHSISGDGTLWQKDSFGPWCHWPIFKSAGYRGRLRFGRLGFWLCSVPGGASAIACVVYGCGLASAYGTSYTGLRAPLCFHIA